MKITLVKVTVATEWHSSDDDCRLGNGAPAGQYQPVILEARQAYLGQEEDRLASRADQLEEFVHYVKGEITKVVGK